MAEQKRTITSLFLLDTPLLMQPRILLAFWAASAHCRLTSSFSSVKTPKSFSTELLSRRPSPSQYPYLRFSQLKCSTLHLAFYNLIQFTWAHFSSMSRSLWLVSLPCMVSTTPLSLVLSANLLGVLLISLTVSLIKMLKSTGPKIDHWGTPCV